MPQSSSENVRAKRQQYGLLHQPNGPTKYNPTQYQREVVEKPEPAPTIDQSKQGSILQRFGLSLPAAKPVDPLTGAGHPAYEDVTGADIKGVADAIHSQNTILANMLVEMAAQRPAMPLVIDGSTPTQAGKNNDYYFLLDNKKVPALNVLIYNNTGGTVNIAFDEPATANDVPLVTGTSLNVADIKTEFISIYTPTSIAVSRLRNGPKVANSIVINGWGNGEWRNFWGQI